jgi:hypothetical protein
MFQSGLVKLQSGCPTWWQLTAMDFHYESQCLPTPLAYYAHQLPHWLHALSVVAVYVIEVSQGCLGPVHSWHLPPIHSLARPLVAGLGFCGPMIEIVRDAFSLFRAVSATSTAGWLGADLPHGVVLLIIAAWQEYWPHTLLSWQLLIMATGNYNFFNFLTSALALACMDDARALFQACEARMLFDLIDLRVAFLQRCLPLACSCVVFATRGAGRDHYSRAVVASRRTSGQRYWACWSAGGYRTQLWPAVFLGERRLARLAHLVTCVVF